MQTEIVKNLPNLSLVYNWIDKWFCVWIGLEIFKKVFDFNFADKIIDMVFYPNFLMVANAVLDFANFLPIMMKNKYFFYN